MGMIVGRACCCLAHTPEAVMKTFYGMGRRGIQWNKRKWAGFERGNRWIKLNWLRERRQKRELKTVNELRKGKGKPREKLRAGTERKKRGGIQQIESWKFWPLWPRENKSWERVSKLSCREGISCGRR
jgi:hypothetical protein